MIRNKEQVFLDLDKHASEFNFPVLDNAYVEFAATRLTAFEGAGNWLLVFEVLGFSTREVAFVNDFYAFGSCVEKEGFVGERILLASAPKEPIFDKETNECVADWSHWSIDLGAQIISFTPSRDEYAQAGITIDRAPGKGTLTEIELLRFLVHKLGHQHLFMNDSELLTYFPRCKSVSKFIQTNRWRHPDIADGEKPSETVSLRSLVEALFRGDPNVFDPGRPNTEWKSWAQTT
jgi:hypothetical protein